ncbi:hypothetical protein VB264_06855 [Arcicella aquatica]|uniref:Uncharacterized protein n=1 Tax=Arcicella aquatica TaxID=217141 RepID=A0ABU5QLB9_9BACT|nr:hypothetical protein [Arcicella aquatica]MEA5257494.1 hypothetical protein [Arcicella aquatica]
MARTRHERINDFDEFFRTAVATFSGFGENDTKATKFQNIYVLNICPGSRAGGTNNRVVEIFWGSRPFEAITQGRNWTALTEYGATLLYERDDSGFVVVSIFPANTDNRKPIESSITLDIRLDPIKLKNKSYLKKNWKELMAYMESTSLDGNPTFLQRQRVSYLRTFKNLVIDNKWTPTKLSVFVREVFKWVLTVGLSGIIIYVLTQLTQPTTTETEIQLKKVNKNLEAVSKKLDKISQGNFNLKTISITADSLARKSKEILEPIVKQKTK